MTDGFAEKPHEPNTAKKRRSISKLKIEIKIRTHEDRNEFPLLKLSPSLSDEDPNDQQQGLKPKVRSGSGSSVSKLCNSSAGNFKVFENNVLVRELLETRGEGRVLVIDGGGSKRCALLGGNLGQSAQNMGWAGIVINGCVKDVDEINGSDIGVRALASHPQKSNKKGVGEKHVTIHFAGTLIRDGEWLYADSDGILVSKTELSV
ncbi:putative 4-hydroxy-4-methyl-2-oxoglutarate aldolase 3 [Camellia sinensis]|uniref:putative 4-hydroxy-4-methyl-2-oxoglutarate aldolase 3 n=1 Tax=Camellia sinensis TaxID=4442 RepID=UPI001036134C|nr:putative 4-hydroxy-4-methyl-2-oxoglutarate aldolase 3 [Camellia sinensis]